ncbi:hypothetical protein LUZ60_007289 [Juncus effusus]|nr:hypothetical protein LUZ60_007289 [Juncus effusus]
MGHNYIICGSWAFPQNIFHMSSPISAYHNVKPKTRLGLYNIQEILFGSARLGSMYRLNPSFFSPSTPIQSSNPLNLTLKFEIAPLSSPIMANFAMDEEKTWWTFELLLHSLNLPSSVLTSLLSSLSFPPSSPLPPHIHRLFLLRHLLSLSASLDPLDALKTLDLLLPNRPAPPCSSLCNAYASLLFYISLSLTVCSSDAACCIDRIRKYEFGTMILGRLNGMMRAVDGGPGRSCVAVRVVSAKNKAVLAVKEFVEEQFGLLGPPFLLRAAEAFLKEQNKNINEVAHTSAVRNYLEQNQDVRKGKDKMDVIKRKISEIISDENQDNSAKKSKLNGENCTEKDRTQPIDLSKTNELNPNPNPNRPIGKNTQENQDISGKKNKLNEENCAEKTNELNPNTSIGKNTEENLERTEMRGQENNRGKNVNDPCTSHAHDTNKKGQNGIKPSLMDRNRTAHTFEWDEAIEEEREMERSSSRQKRRASKPKKASYPFRKRRPKRKWTEQEVEALIKAVKKIGKGNWQQMVDIYGDEFDDRTAVDLKDKWRNMGN